MMKMKRKVAKKWLNTLWPCRISGRPNMEVGIIEDGKIKIGAFLDPNSPSDFAFFINRRLARLLAKRINQCLDDTGRL